MKNLLNCHSVGLHSFPVSFENGLYRRIFYADYHHNLWRHKPIEIAIHSHHVDIKITVLEGYLNNHTYDLHGDGMLMGKYLWESVINNGTGGFRYLGRKRVRYTGHQLVSPGNSIKMRACEMHTVSVAPAEKCVWLIEETIPTCEYLPINYSDQDLTKWTHEGLYQEVNQRIANSYIDKYRHLL